jgi:hypothetical protein
MLTITLPTPRTAIVSGIQFTEGVATVEALSSNRRAFFEHSGATIDTPADESSPSMSWNRDRLAEHATALGHEVTENATKAEILALIEGQPAEES